MSINPLSGPPTPTTDSRRHADGPAKKVVELHGFQFESVVKEIRLDMILVDHSYQHSLKQTKVNRFAKNFQIRQFGIPVVNKRANGYFYLVDGQHRVAAANLLQDPPTTIRCEVFSGLTLEEESWLYHELNGTRDDLTPMELFVAAINAGHPEELAIKAAVEEAGMEVTRGGSSSSHVQSVTSLFQVYRRFGGPLLTRTLSIMHRAWPTEKDPCHHTLIVGMAFLLDKEKEINEKRLIHVLNLVTPSVVVGRSRVLRVSLASSTIKATVTALTGLYNNGMRGKRIGED
jgi:ParB-like nuclease domain